MPISGGEGAIIGAGIGLAGQLINANQTRKTNQSAEAYANRMYMRQRQDALADWHMQNQYNSPQAQMQRLVDAGLNPNLVYGATAPGNSSGQVHSATPQQWRPQAPQFDLGSIANSYFNIAMQSAQLDNVRATNDKIQAETRAIAAQAGTREATLPYAAQQFRNQMELTQFKKDDAYLDLQVKGQGQDERMRLEEERIRNIMEAQRLDLKIKSLISDGKSVDNILKNLEVDLQKNGLSSKDPAVVRVLGRIIGQFFNLSNINQR